MKVQQPSQAHQLVVPNVLTRPMAPGFQLWVNLPAKDKWVAPRYQDTPPSKMPTVPIPGTKASTVKVIAGAAAGASSAIETRTPIVFLVSEPTAANNNITIVVLFAGH